MIRARTEELLLGEWACLGVLSERKAHGYDVAMRLAPSGDVGRVWSMSRSLDQLQQRGVITAVNEERGLAGGTRTILGPTRRGRAMLRRWISEPVEHLREVRTEFLLKVVLSEILGIETATLINAQRTRFAPIAANLKRPLSEGQMDGPVEVWRDESSRAVLRFLDRLAHD